MGAGGGWRGLSGWFFFLHRSLLVYLWGWGSGSGGFGLRLGF